MVSNHELRLLFYDPNCFCMLFLCLCVSPLPPLHLCRCCWSMSKSLFGSYLFLEKNTKHHYVWKNGTYLSVDVTKASKAYATNAVRHLFYCFPKNFCRSEWLRQVAAWMKNLLPSWNVSMEKKQKAMKAVFHSFLVLCNSFCKCVHFTKHHWIDCGLYRPCWLWLCGFSAYT